MIDAFLLHRRSFRESSIIASFLTKQQGLKQVIVKGAKRPNSKLKSSLQFFTPLMIDCYGRGDLKGLKNADALAIAPTFIGKQLYALLYVNELLCKLLQAGEVHTAIFFGYQQLLNKLSQNHELERCLREFEMTVLDDLGYGMMLGVDSESGEVLQDSRLYHVSLDNGVRHCDVVLDTYNKLNYFTGIELRNIQNQLFSDAATLRAAKRLSRQLFNELLNFRPLNSRELFG